MRALFLCRLFICLLFCSLPGYFLFAQAPAKTRPQESNSTIPLIDRELFFANPEITNGQLSPDGTMISFLKRSKGVMNIWVKKTDEPLSKARVVTTSDQPLDKYTWTADSRYILFAHSIWGNDQYNIFAVDPSRPDDSLEVRNLTPFDTVSAILYQPSKKNPDLVWIGLNNRDRRWYDLFSLQISTGDLKLVRKNNDSLRELVFDGEEIPRLGIRYSSPDSAALILRLNKDGSSTKIFETAVTESARPLAFTEDNQWFYMATNKGANQDLIKLVLMNPATLEIRDLGQDPQEKADLDEVCISRVSHQPIYTSYADERTRFYWKDTGFQADHALLRSKFPGRDIRILSLSDDEKQALYSISGDDKLEQVFLLDRSSRELTLQYIPYASLKPYEAFLSKMEPITYQSSDETTIPAYVSLPRGMTAKNLPLIILPHDGPWCRVKWGFNPLVQWLTNRGYAVLQMNYRGSAGYGKKFLNAGNRQWGKLIQDDITWGVNEMIGKGIADPKRIGILGNGFGGYATLAGIGFTGDLYAAAVDINGPASLLNTYSNFPGGWSGTRKLFRERVGDPSVPASKNALARYSPLNADTAFRTPLLIVHAQQSGWVTKPENDQIVVTMRDSSRKVEYLSAPGLRFPFENEVDNLAVYARMENFLGRTLRGRYQETIRPETTKRLKEITVDVASLTLGVAKPVLALQEFPPPSADLAVGNYTYSLLVELPGRKVPLGMNRLIMSDSLNWVVSERITGQMGDQADEASYQKGSLHLVNRKTLQRGKTTEYAFNGSDVTTTAQDKTISASVDGAYLHNGAGYDLLIARLPLKEGYETGFYLVGDDGKPKFYQLRVTGKDTIYSEPCLKVELINAENTSISTQMWINMTHKMAYRTIVPLAALPGARMTISLNQQPSLPKFLLFLWMITPAHGFN